MSETVLFNLITYGITAIVTIALAAITAWKTAKLGAHAGAVEAMEPVSDKLQANADKLEDVKGHVSTLKREIDGRLTEYRKLIESKAIVDVAAALIQGREEGARMREAETGKSAADILEKAKLEAEEILQTARQAAEELKVKK